MSTINISCCLDSVKSSNGWFDPWEYSPTPPKVDGKTLVRVSGELGCIRTCLSNIRERSVAMVMCRRYSDEHSPYNSEHHGTELYLGGSWHIAWQTGLHVPQATEWFLCRAEHSNYSHWQWLSKMWNADIWAVSQLILWLQMSWVSFAVFFAGLKWFCKCCSLMYQSWHGIVTLQVQRCISMSQMEV